MKIIVSGETFDVEVEEVLETAKHGRGGCVFRFFTGKKFFLPYEKFQFVV